MAVLHMTIKEVYEVGYFEGQRLFSIAQEMEARAEEHLCLLLDRPHTAKEYRDTTMDWMKKRQPREYPNHGQVPKEIQARLGKIFNG